MAGSRNNPCAGLEPWSSPLEPRLVYEVEADTGGVVVGGAAPVGKAIAAGVVGGVEDVVTAPAAAVVDRNCACWARRENAVAARRDFVGSGQQAGEEGNCSGEAGAPSDWCGTNNGEQRGGSSRGAAEAAVRHHCGRDRRLVGEEGQRREKGGTWAERGKRRRGPPVEEGEGDKRDGLCLWHAMLPWEKVGNKKQKYQPGDRCCSNCSLSLYCLY